MSSVSFSSNFLPSIFQISIANYLDYPSANLFFIPSVMLTRQSLSYSYYFVILSMIMAKMLHLTFACVFVTMKFLETAHQSNRSFVIYYFSFVSQNISQKVLYFSSEQYYSSLRFKSDITQELILLDLFASYFKTFFRRVIFYS